VDAAGADERSAGAADPVQAERSAAARKAIDRTPPAGPLTNRSIIDRTRSPRNSR
jgi:hypothetical protein